VAALCERGVTLVEAAIVLSSLAILTAVAAPTASRTLDRARFVRAVADGEAIKAAIVNYRADAFQGFSTNGASNGPLVEMLVSDGDIPRELGATGEAQWQAPVATGGPGIVTMFLEDHLVMNTVGYPLTGGNAWRGPYLDAPLDPDPWGNRYAVNVRFLRAPANTQRDTVVLSAGPDERIDTAFDRDGMFPGGDDIIVMVLRDRNSDVP
jgi:type II secretory pathway pseudopilin PulG